MFCTGDNWTVQHRNTLCIVLSIDFFSSIEGVRVDQIFVWGEGVAYGEGWTSMCCASVVDE
jgi:hypothetical protein